MQNANPLVERSLRLNSCIGSMQWKEGNRKSHAFYSEFSFHSITSGNNISKNCPVPAFDYSLSSTVQHAANISNRRNGVTKALGKLPNRLLTGTEETFLSKIRTRMFLSFPDPDPLVRGTDARIRNRIRIRTKMSRIINTDQKLFARRLFARRLFQCILSRRILTKVDMCNVFSGSWECFRIQRLQRSPDPAGSGSGSAILCKRLRFISNAEKTQGYVSFKEGGNYLREFSRAWNRPQHNVGFLEINL